MLLAVDVGNTNIVFALFEGREIKSRWRVATDPRRTADEYAVWLLQLMQLQGFDRNVVSKIIISTVVPRALHNLEVLAQKYFGLDPLIAGQAPVEWGFEADVDEPRSLGADRAVNTVAAHAKYSGDLIVVDFGTATTFDVVDFNGAYNILKNIPDEDVYFLGMDPTKARPEDMFFTAMPVAPNLTRPTLLL
ncbi:MAG: type III pantothenate kinase, partial [Novosphingobium sp.]